MSFDGFTKETISFLAGLSKHNDKTWFDAHRADYDAHLLEPAKAFVVALAPKLRAIDARLHAEPRVNGSIFRINRDTRFSKDKTPYKDHLDLWFWSGKQKGWDCSGFYFRLTPKLLVLGAGMHDFTPPVLAKYRKAVLDDKKGKRLVEIQRSLAKAGYRFGGEKYKRPPRGVDESHPRVALLKYGALFTGWEGKHPKELFTKRAVDFVIGHYKTLAPVHEWLEAM